MSRDAGAGRQRRMAGRCAALAAVGLAVHAAPGALGLGPVRAAVSPRLCGRGRVDHVALTFDDGPDPASTPQVLGVLAELDVQATFFCLGGLVRRGGGLTAEIAAAGHELAVHGDDHAPLLLRPPHTAYRDLLRARDSIALATTEPVTWWRPAYGVPSAAALVAARRLGLRPVLWTAWGRDWEAASTPATVLAELRRGLAGGRAVGATVLLHDADISSAPQSWRATLGALPDLVGELRDRGLTVGPLREHGL